MADPVRHSDLNTYLKRAEQALEEANSASLDNVRQRCLRAEAAWRAMAERAERSERMKADELARKRAAQKQCYVATQAT
jgi:hypothetical protein